MCGKIVPIGQLSDSRYGSVLCYPRFDPDETERRVEQLKSVGVKAVEFTGEKMAFNLLVLGKGKVGIVLTAHTKTRRVALKIRRVDSERKDMTQEAEMLRRANEAQVGPRLVGVRRDFLLMEFLQGVTLPEWVSSIEGKGARNRIRAVLLDILQQCRRLDEIGLDHGELSRAPKHIIIDSQDHAHIVDFEAASAKRRPSNVTSICQYLFIGSQLARTLRRKLGQIKTQSLVSALHHYKFVRTGQNFAAILKVCNFEPRGRRRHARGKMEEKTAPPPSRRGH